MGGDWCCWITSASMRKAWSRHHPKPSMVPEPSLGIMGWERRSRRCMQRAYEAQCPVGAEDATPAWFSRLASKRMPPLAVEPRPSRILRSLRTDRAANCERVSKLRIEFGIFRVRRDSESIEGLAKEAAGGRSENNVEDLTIVQTEFA